MNFQTYYIKIELEELNLYYFYLFLEWPILLTNITDKHNKITPFFFSSTRVEYVKGGAAPLFLMGQVFEVFFEVFSLFCRIIMDYVRTQIRASF